MNSLNEYNVSTNFGQISVMESSGRGQPVLFIHGNSADKETFYKQFDSELAKKYRFIAMDLPGHGKSDKANETDRDKTYSFDGYADVAIDVINKLGLEKPVVVGWSLGGHIALSVVQKSQKLAGMLITGTPPIKVSPEGFQQGFLPLPLFQTLFAKIEFSREEANEFMSGGGFDTQIYPNIVDSAIKTDGYARKHLVDSMMKGVGGDQKALVETDETPLCIVQGSDDKGINNKFIVDSAPGYKNLFNKKVYIVENSGHAVFWQKPEEFNEILGTFLSNVSNK